MSFLTVSIDESTLKIPSRFLTMMDIVPLYMTSKYHDLMIHVVTKEINRVYKLFIERNPYFLKNNGQVSIVAHSLGVSLYQYMPHHYTDLLKLY